MNVSLQPGAKVKWIDHPHYGLGEILKVQDGHASIRYYSSPTTHLDLFVPQASLQKVTISPQSAGFIHQNGASRYLRVLVAAEQPAPLQTYKVQLAGDITPTEAVEDEFHLFAYAARPDSVEILTSLTTPSPFFFEARHTLLKALLQQLQFSKGLTSILSSRIEIYSHQVEVVRRILTDPQMRYLLADEVGLGKTIEAGMVVRQVQLDAPGAKVLVLTPDALTEQWQTELREHFGLESPICPHSLLGTSACRGPYDILVVDEAHRLLEGRAYQSLKNLTVSSRHVLLLSATPSLNNSRELLAMLELLDPTNYQLANIHEFEDKLLRRQQIGQEMLALSTAESPLFIRKSIVRLQNLLPDDTTVQALSRRLQVHGNDPTQVRDALQAHISETYRIYRRMLRTRRHWLSEAKDKVAARKIELKIEYEPDDTVPKRLWTLLENWRCRVLADHPGELARAAALENYFEFAASIASFPGRLPRLISRRLAATQTSEDERSSLLQLASVASMPEALPEARQGKLLQNLLANIVRRGKSKVIIFCSTCEAAEAIHGLLNSRPLVRGSIFLQRVTSKTPRAVLSGALKAFAQESGVHILISDQTLEEGFNLHAADAIVFYDLPWDLIRIEQRIGRTDRIARGGLKFPCYLLISLEDDDDDQLALDEAWRRGLCEEGIDIFRHPASDLQYVAPKILSTVREAAFAGGPRALSAVLPEIRRLVEEERKAIEEQDLVDGLHVPRDVATRYADRLSKADQAAGEFGASLQAYMQGNLGLTAWWQDNTVSFQRRREPIVPAETLLPLAPMLNRPTTVYRNIAIEQPQVEFLRPGHQAIDHCQWLLLNDMRGRAFIMWRYLPAQHDIKLIFRFILYSEINLSPFKAACISMDPLAQNGLLRLVRQWFPSRADELWLELAPGEEYIEAPQSLIALCRNPYQKHHDRNMGEQRACHVLREFGAKRWKSICHAASREALRMFLSSEALALALQDSQKEAVAYFTTLKAQLESRIHARVEGASALSQAIRDESVLQDLVHVNLAAPETHIDTVGVYLLSERPFWQEQA